MSEALPTAIVARLDDLGRELMEWARDQRDGSLADHEQAVLSIIRKASPELLGLVLQASTTSLGQAQARVRENCPSCRRRTRVHSWRNRRVTTTCGSVRFERSWYLCRRCGVGWSPTDQRLGLPTSTRLSRSFQQWVGRVGASTTFREAAELLVLLTGNEVGPETVRRRTEQQGAELERIEHQAAQQVEATQEAAEPVDPAPGLLLVEADGVQVHYLDGWHEVKVGLIAGYQQGRARAASYVAARASPAQFGARWLAEAARRGALDVVAWEGTLANPGLATLRPVVVLGDGAAWIWNLAADHFGQRTESVDFYHAAEHLWNAARVLHGGDTPRTRAWAESQVQHLMANGAISILDSLDRAELTGDQAAEALRREHGYFRTNAARMEYPRFRTQGLPIGSGAVESTAKHLVQQRLKRAGMRWSEAGAAAVLTLRAHLASGRLRAA